MTSSRLNKANQHLNTIIEMLNQFLAEQIKNPKKNASQLEHIRFIARTIYTLVDPNFNANALIDNQSIYKIALPLIDEIGTRNIRATSADAHQVALTCIVDYVDKLPASTFRTALIDATKKVLDNTKMLLAPKTTHKNLSLFESLPPEMSDIIFKNELQTHSNYKTFSLVSKKLRYTQIRLLFEKKYNPYKAYHHGQFNPSVKRSRLLASWIQHPNLLAEDITIQNEIEKFILRDDITFEELTLSFTCLAHVAIIRMNQVLIEKYVRELLYLDSIDVSILTASCLLFIIEKLKFHDEHIGLVNELNKRLINLNSDSFNPLEVRKLAGRLYSVTLLKNHLTDHAFLKATDYGNSCIVQNRKPLVTKLSGVLPSKLPSFKVLDILNNLSSNPYEQERHFVEKIKLYFKEINKDHIHRIVDEINNSIKLSPNLASLYLEEFIKYNDSTVISSIFLCVIPELINADQTIKSRVHLDIDKVLASVQKTVHYDIEQMRLMSKAIANIYAIYPDIPFGSINIIYNKFYQELLCTFANELANLLLSDEYRATEFFRTAKETKRLYNNETYYFIISELMKSCRYDYTAIIDILKFLISSQLTYEAFTCLLECGMTYMKSFSLTDATSYFHYIEQFNIDLLINQANLPLVLFGLTEVNPSLKGPCIIYLEQLADRHVAIKLAGASISNAEMKTFVAALTYLMRLHPENSENYFNRLTTNDDNPYYLHALLEITPVHEFNEIILNHYWNRMLDMALYFNSARYPNELFDYAKDVLVHHTKANPKYRLRLNDVYEHMKSHINTRPSHLFSDASFQSLISFNEITYKNDISEFIEFTSWLIFRNSDRRPHYVTDGVTALLKIIDLYPQQVTLCCQLALDLFNDARVFNVLLSEKINIAPLLIAHPSLIPALCNALKRNYSIFTKNTYRATTFCFYYLKIIYSLNNHRYRNECLDVAKYLCEMTEFKSLDADINALLPVLFRDFAQHPAAYQSDLITYYYKQMTNKENNYGLYFEYCKHIYMWSPLFKNLLTILHCRPDLFNQDIIDCQIRYYNSHILQSKSIRENLFILHRKYTSNFNLPINLSLKNDQIAQLFSTSRSHYDLIRTSTFYGDEQTFNENIIFVSVSSLQNCPRYLDKQKQIEAKFLADTVTLLKRGDTTSFFFFNDFNLSASFKALCESTGQYLFACTEYIASRLTLTSKIKLLRSMMEWPSAQTGLMSYKYLRSIILLIDSFHSDMEKDSLNKLLSSKNPNILNLAIAIHDDNLLVNASHERIKAVV